MLDDRFEKIVQHFHKKSDIATGFCPHEKGIGSEKGNNSVSY
jgi:hypothetical protein